MVNEKFHFLAECAGGLTKLARRMTAKGCSITRPRLSQWYTENQHHPQTFYIPVLLEIAREIGLDYATADLQDDE